MAILCCVAKKAASTAQRLYFKWQLTRIHKDGSGEPVIKKHYKTLYYLIIYSVYDVILQVYRINTCFTFLFFALLFLCKKKPAE
jgi:hypothetical protein